MSEPLSIDYYTDILCVWAWVAQRRNEELQVQFGDKVQLNYHYINLFGDVDHRMNNQWLERGGYKGFADHVREVVQPYDSAPVNKNIWKDVRPKTSANAHLIFKAVKLIHGVEASGLFARKVRSKFFEECVDIGRQDILLELVEVENLLTVELEKVLVDGRAMAALMQDYQKAQQNNIKGSPSWVLDGGRQVLYGNVGYRVLSANVEELLRQPVSEASWC